MPRVGGSSAEGCRISSTEWQGWGWSLGSRVDGRLQPRLRGPARRKWQPPVPHTDGRGRASERPSPCRRLALLIRSARFSHGRPVGSREDFGEAGGEDGTEIPANLKDIDGHCLL